MTERRLFEQSDGGDNLYSRLLDGKTPDWLSRVPVAPGISGDFRFYRVRR